jgi:hypothetical protein
MIRQVNKNNFCIKNSVTEDDEERQGCDHWVEGDAGPAQVPAHRSPVPLLTQLAQLRYLHTGHLYLYSHSWPSSDTSIQDI